MYGSAAGFSRRVPDQEKTVTRKCDGLNESTDKHVLPKVLVDGDRLQRVGQQAGALSYLVS